MSVNYRFPYAFRQLEITRNVDGKPETIVYTTNPHTESVESFCKKNGIAPQKWDVAAYVTNIGWPNMHFETFDGKEWKGVSDRGALYNERVISFARAQELGNTIEFRGAWISIYHELGGRIFDSTYNSDHETNPNLIVVIREDGEWSEVVVREIRGLNEPTDRGFRGWAKNVELYPGVQKYIDLAAENEEKRKAKADEAARHLQDEEVERQRVRTLLSSYIKRAVPFLVPAARDALKGTYAFEVKVVNLNEKTGFCWLEVGWKDHRYNGSHSLSRDTNIANIEATAEWARDYLIQNGSFDELFRHFNEDGSLWPHG